MKKRPCPTVSYVKERLSDDENPPDDQSCFQKGNKQSEAQPDFAHCPRSVVSAACATKQRRGNAIVWRRQAFWQEACFLHVFVPNEEKRPHCARDQLRVITHVAFHLSRCSTNRSLMDRCLGPLKQFNAGHPSCSWTQSFRFCYLETVFTHSHCFLFSQPLDLFSLGIAGAIQLCAVFQFPSYVTQPTHHAASAGAHTCIVLHAFFLEFVL